MNGPLVGCGRIRRERHHLNRNSRHVRQFRTQHMHGCRTYHLVVVSGHVSNPGARESTRRRLTAKQADTVDRLGNAAMGVLSREGFSGLTIRMVATEAGVGAATAYTYFSSKEHLVAEVFWRRLASSPIPPTESPDSTARVVAVLRQIALLVAEQPPLAGAVT